MAAGRLSLHRPLMRRRLCSSTEAEQDLLGGAWEEGEGGKSTATANSSSWCGGSGQQHAKGHGGWIPRPQAPDEALPQ